MPNHCTNRLCITGPKKDRDAFFATIDKDGFDFNQTVPMPKSVFRGNLSMEDEKKYPGEKNWYGWGVANWGTKWSNYNTGKVVNGNRSIKVKFDTAWCPPVKWLENASKKFPSLKFSLSYSIEGGMGKGRYVAEAGQSAEVA